MNYNFDTWANHQNNGNMKGLWAKDIPADAVMLSGAEMDYITAPFITDALHTFVSNGLFGFTLPDEAYQATICNWLLYVRNWTIDPDYIVPALGTVFACSTAIRAFTQEGDGIIIQHPSYSRLNRAILHNDRKVISNPLIERDGVYTIDYDDLETKMADSTVKMMILVNPQNPTGRVFSQSDLQQIAELASKYHVIVFSDEIFAETAQPEHPVIPYAKIDPIWGLTCTSLGKTFNLTGVNHANMIIPNPALRTPYITQRNRDHFGSIDPFFYTILRAAYSKEGYEWLQQMNLHTKENYSLLAQTIQSEMPLLSLSPLEGTFTAWIDCRQLDFTEQDLHCFFTEDAMVYPDFGEEYGLGGHGFVRINLATTTDTMRKAIDNLIRAYRKICN